MSDYSVIEENEQYRVRLETDQYPDEPYDDGQPPTLRIYRGHAEHIYTGSSRPHDSDDAVENAVSHWVTTPSDHDWPLFEKYLRAYFGTTKIDTWHSGDYWYVAYDTAEWRQYAGVTDLERLHREDFLAEWKAYVEGEVYTCVIERKVTGSKVYDDEREDESFAEWEVTDSCGGFYGYEYAKEAALEEFASYQEGK